YAFVNGMPADEQRAAYEQQVVPETGRIFFQAGLSVLDRRRATRVNFRNPARAPLLLIQGAMDHVVAPGMVRANFRKYRHSPAQTDFKVFPGRNHWILAQDGWEEVADYIAGWLQVLPNAQA